MDMPNHGETVEYRSCKIANGQPCLPCSKGIDLDLDALIIQTRKALDDLLSQKQDLHREINTAHDPFISRLPPELSTSIFHLSLSEEEPPSVLDKDITESFITTPLTLGAVCGTWRSIAWASPRLWTHISIPVRPELEHYEDDYLDIADDWLARACQLPLSIRLYAPPNALPNCHPTLLDRLSGIMGDCMPRCRRLEVSCPYNLLPSIQSQAPILEEIKVTSDIEEDSDFCDQLIGLRSIKSKGLSLSIRGYILGGFWLPFKKVVKFEGMITPDEFLVIFRKSPNLRECRILGLNEPARSRIPEPSIIHHRLRKLTLLSESFRSCTLIPILNLPSLTHLSVSGISIGPLHDFILRSGCNLRHLRLVSFSPEHKFYDMCRAASTLEELHLSFDAGFVYKSIDQFFKALASNPVVGDPSRTGSPFLPNLSVLTMRTAELTKFSWKLASRIFGSLADIRNPQKRPLMNLRIIHDHSVTEPVTNSFVLTADVTRRFLDITQEGININLYDDDTQDILIRSLERHKIAVPDWYRTKVKDFVEVFSRDSTFGDSWGDQDSNSDEELEEEDPEDSDSDDWLKFKEDSEDSDSDGSLGEDVEDSESG